MKKALRIIGGCILALSAISGFMTGGVVGILGGLLGGAIAAITFFALAQILEGQDEIKYEIAELRTHTKAVSNTINGVPPCPKCGKDYDSELSSCPHCGYRP